MTNNDLSRHVPRLSQARVLCIGDVMVDRFVYGSVDRISPEAPIPVLCVEREIAMLGGAGNVVRNLTALGAEACFISLVGDDAAGREIAQLIAREPKVEPHLLIEPGRQTTIKTRMVAGSHQLLRADRETKNPTLPELAGDLIRRAEAALRDYKILILSDYGKGLLSDDLLRALIDAAKAASVPVIVDPKGRDYARYDGVTYCTPNRRELSEATGGMPTDTEVECVAAARTLITRSPITAVIVTRSQQGLSLIPRDGEAIHFPSEAREVFDVSGAGDTVIATLSAALAADIPLIAACALANRAAGVVVGKIGTAVCKAAELISGLQASDVAASENKVVGLDSLLARVALWRQQNLKIAFTNGCFDLLHPGHLSLLRQARAASDRLIVGLNSDQSVRRLKGINRPIQSEIARAIVLASLTLVDAVILFDDDTPLSLIKELRPDVLVKGADYAKEEVVGGPEVETYGGKILLATLTPGHSTTSTIAKING